MKVSTLKTLLEGVDDDLDVMIAHQPSWPLAETLAAGLLDSERDVHDEQSDGFYDGEDEPQDVFWLVAGGASHARSPYAPRDVFERW